MNSYAYRDYVPKLAKQMADALGDIQVEHNFEYGEEFEIAVCRVLRLALPEQYGICRGYVTTASGDAAGDDIIIYERSRFPTLRFHQRDDFSRKEYIPIEAVFAYIEAKYTVNLFGDDGQSLSFAASQVRNVKSLLATREAIGFSQFDPYITSGIQVEPPNHLPSIRNPPFAAIFAAAGRVKSGGPRELSYDAIAAGVNELRVSTSPPPDLLVIGTNFVLLPVISATDDESKTRLATSFFLENKSEYHGFNAKGNAFGLALVSIMAALDWIRLDRMPWYDVITDALTK